MKNLQRMTVFAIAFYSGWMTSAIAQVKAPLSHSLPAAINEAQIRAAAVESFPEYLQLLSLPNDSLVSAEDIQVNASQLEKLFQQRGFKTQQFANQGKPLVLAEYLPNSTSPNKKTVLFYLHFDGQPVISSQWAQQSPWQPVVKKKDASGKWQIVATEEILRADFDPELRVFGRAAADDKGPIMMFLAAFDLMRAQGLTPAVNVKVMLDSEEEVNSPGIVNLVKEKKDFFKADALVIHDMAAHPSGRPTAIFGNRGVQTLSLTVYGPKAPLHSGHYGNLIVNPAFSLARLLASMKDEQGRVLIQGYYAKTKLSPVDTRVLDAVKDDEAALKRRVGVAVTEKVASNYQRALQYPSLNIRGMVAASVGNSAANIIPQEALAEIDIRTTQEANAQYLTERLRQHIIKQGYHVIDHAPDDAERQRYPKLLQLQTGLPANAARQSIAAPIRHWVERAQKAAYAELSVNADKTKPAQNYQPLIIRASGATVPTHEIVSPLGLPFVIVPTVNVDNNQHTYDENLRLGNYLSGMRIMLGLLNTTYP